MSSKRFQILDLYRFLAILIVMVYHYYSRWYDPKNSIDLYPYSNKYDHFLWGRLGVQFFFIISGFVIYMTLERSLSLLDFAKKRLVRLWPSMLLISTITYLVFKLFDNDVLFKDSHSLSNLFYSWTFLGESMNPIGLRFIDGSYWSLWVEVQFYILSALIYFFLKKSDKISFFPFVLFFIAFFTGLAKPLLKEVHEVFNLFLFFNFFVMGVVFKELFRVNNPWTKSNWYWHVIIVVLLFLEWYRFSDDRTTMAMDTLFVMFFYLFLYLSKLNWSPNNRIFNTFIFLGEASYISYLLHQNLGVLIINKIGYVGTFDFIVPLGVIAFIFSLSAILYKYFEKPMMGILKQFFFQPN